jgi:hypothetical protein
MSEVNEAPGVSEHPISDPPESATDAGGSVPADPLDPTTAGTGDREVDDIVARLETLDALPLEKHAEVFDDLQGRLASVLERRPAQADEPASMVQSTADSTTPNLSTSEH